MPTSKPQYSTNHNSIIKYLTVIHQVKCLVAFVISFCFPITSSLDCLFCCLVLWDCFPLRLLSLGLWSLADIHLRPNTHRSGLTPSVCETTDSINGRLLQPSVSQNQLIVPMEPQTNHNSSRRRSSSSSNKRHNGPMVPASAPDEECHLSECRISRPDELF